MRDAGETTANCAPRECEEKAGPFITTMDCNMGNGTCSNWGDRTGFRSSTGDALGSLLDASYLSSREPVRGQRPGRAEREQGLSGSADRIAGGGTKSEAPQPRGEKKRPRRVAQPEQQRQRSTLRIGTAAFSILRDRTERGCSLQCFLRSVGGFQESVETLGSRYRQKPIPSASLLRWCPALPPGPTARGGFGEPNTGWRPTRS